MAANTGVHNEQCISIGALHGMMYIAIIANVRKAKPVGEDS